MAKYFLSFLLVFNLAPATAFAQAHPYYNKPANGICYMAAELKSNNEAIDIVRHGEADAGRDGSYSYLYCATWPWNGLGGLDQYPMCSGQGDGLALTQSFIYNKRGLSCKPAVAFKPSPAPAPAPKTAPPPKPVPAPKPVPKPAPKPAPQAVAPKPSPNPGGELTGAQKINLAQKCFSIVHMGGTSYWYQGQQEASVYDVRMTYKPGGECGRSIKFSGVLGLMNWGKCTTDYERTSVDKEFFDWNKTYHSADNVNCFATVYKIEIKK